jgi:preprotein translocase subunit SecY
MLESFGNIVKVKELRWKLAVTALLLVVFRLGKFIPTPGVDVVAITERLAQIDTSSALGKIMNLADMFTGGALQSGAIFGLGIMPYITASIIFQLLAGIIPALERLQREGPSGRKKIQQYTRVAAVVLCLFQSAILCNQLLEMRANDPANDFLVPVEVLSDAGFYFFGILSLTVGTIFLMWLGEQIDEFGIGNGISILIMAGIIARMPRTVAYIRDNFNAGGLGGQGDINLFDLVILGLLFVGMVLAVVLITLGQRRIPVQQAKATRGRRVYGGQRSYLPLRVNQSGVIPIIFAQSLLILPPLVLGALGFQDAFGWGSYWYMVCYVALIVFFSYFYTAVVFNPDEMADNLKQSNSSIPGIRPGKRTAEFLEHVMTRIALAGAIFLSFVAVVPTFINRALDVPYGIAAFLGGTGLLIVVGVALDVAQRVESYLLMKHYDGFVKGGKAMRGRRR